MNLHFLLRIIHDFITLKQHFTLAFPSHNPYYCIYQLHKMKLKFFCPRWGSEQLSWDDFLLKVVDAGYNGVEFGVPNETTPAALEQILGKIEKHGLDAIPQHYATYDADFSKHIDAYAGWLELIKPFRPLKIDSQTGKDFFTFEQNKQLIDLAFTQSQDNGVPIYHETHRNKFTFAAHITKD